MSPASDPGRARRGGPGRAPSCRQAEALPCRSPDPTEKGRPARGGGPWRPAAVRRARLRRRWAGWPLLLGPLPVPLGGPNANVVPIRAGGGGSGRLAPGRGGQLGELLGEGKVHVFPNGLELLDVATPRCWRAYSTTSRTRISGADALAVSPRIRTPAEPFGADVLGSLDQVGRRPPWPRRPRTVRSELELLGAPSTSSVSTRRAIALTASCRFWVA